MKKNSFASVRFGLLVVMLILSLVATACGEKATATPQAAARAEAGGAPAPGESTTADKVRESGVLRAGVAVAAPWLMQDPSTNEYFGSAHDLGIKIAEGLGARVEYIETSWDVIVAGLQADKYDIILAPLFASPARMEVIDFVNYARGGTCYFKLKENPLELNSYDELNNPDISIAVSTGTGSEEGIKVKYPNVTLHSLVLPPGAMFPIEEIQAKRSDLGVLDSGLAFMLLDKYPDLAIVPGGPEECLTNPDIPYPIGVGYTKGDDAFGAYMQAIVDDMQEQIDADTVRFSDPKYLMPPE